MSTMLFARWNVLKAVLEDAMVEEVQVLGRVVASLRHRSRYPTVRKQYRSLLCRVTRRVCGRQLGLVPLCTILLHREWLEFVDVLLSTMPLSYDML